MNADQHGYQTDDLSARNAKNAIAVNIPPDKADGFMSGLRSGTIGQSADFLLSLTEKEFVVKELINGQPHNT
jgi:hypothetical protein